LLFANRFKTLNTQSHPDSDLKHLMSGRVDGPLGVVPGGEGEDDGSSVARGAGRKEGTGGGRDHRAGGGVERGGARHGSGRWAAARGFRAAALGGSVSI
jgi:hypothetical protein